MSSKKPVYAVVDSREDSITALSKWLEKRGNRRDYFLKEVRLYSGRDGKNVLLGAYDKQERGGQVVLAMRYPGDELLGAINDGLAEKNGRTESGQKYIVLSHREERGEVEGYQWLDFRQSRTQKRGLNDLVRNYRHYMLMRRVIERAELSPDFLKELVEVTEEEIILDKKEQRDAVNAYIDLGEPDMAGGTYYGMGESKDNAIDKMRERIKINALSDKHHVFITGASGTGKEAAAWATHTLSNRWNKPFFPVNCEDLLPPESVMAKLFGYKKGAFAGAFSDRSGIVHKAAGGTLFLDQLPRLPVDVQGALLRFCETGEFLRVGSSSYERADVRIIAAGCPEDIYEDDGKTLKIRADLFYILNRAILEIPTLKEMEKQCKGTIIKIAQNLLERYTWTQRYPSGDKKGDCFSAKEIAGYKTRIATEYGDMISRYGWERNNVRELDSILQKWILYNDDGYFENYFAHLDQSVEEAMEHFVDAIDEKSLPLLGGKEDVSHDLRSYYVKALQGKYHYSAEQIAKLIRISIPTAMKYLEKSKTVETEAELLLEKKSQKVMKTWPKVKR